MKLEDLKIGTRLCLGLVAIQILVLALGVMAWVNSDRLWRETQGLYEHPLAIRRAVGEIQTHILTIHREMKDLCLTDSDRELETCLQVIDAHEAAALREFEIVYEQYLGPRSDVDEGHRAFVQWRSIRDETIRLRREGQQAVALNRTRPAGPGGGHVNQLLASIRTISDFAKTRGDAFYREAEVHKRSLNRQVTVAVASTLLLSTLIAAWLLRGIRHPLRDLVAAAEQYRQGDLDARSRYASTNEFGTLAASFNALADTIQAEMHINARAAQLAGVMLREVEARAFCQELLKELLQHTGSQIGAVYFLNPQGTEFEHFESIGLGPGKRTAWSAGEREGEFGTALATGQIQRTTVIPENTRFIWTAVSGDFPPREILTIPLLAGPPPSEAMAVISLASVSGYDDAAIRLVQDILSTLTARMTGVLAYRQIQELAERLEHQNRELEVQQRELTAQADELVEQNTLLALQKRQVEEANRLKTVFLANMSHELRTPLNSVIALAGVLNRRLRGKIPTEEYGYLDVIERNGKNLLELINDILDLSRIESGREEVRAGRFWLRELVDQIVAMVEPQIGQKPLALINQVPADLPQVVSDPDKCRHILENLIGNAVKFTEQGRVEISARQVDQELWIAVADTGIGIAAADLPYIFDEFRQADDSASRRFGGTGLGLAIASKYARLLRGGIAVESAPGRGSTFTLRLPWAADGQDVGQAAEPELEAGQDAAVCVPSFQAGQGPCLLLVEDSEPAVIQMTEILAAQGYRVRVARDGQQAWEQIETALPDAVILDLTMPGVDGFQVLRAIRGTDRTASLPVLILTARHVTKEELSFLKGNNIHQLIQKGDISKTGLLAAIGKMVAQKPQKG
jgi:signal transduction histidine kinase/HAMP domain-containing protein